MEPAGSRWAMRIEARRFAFHNPQFAFGNRDEYHAT
jgi:hypothetical protein